MPEGGLIVKAQNNPPYVEISSSQSLEEAATHYKENLISNNWKLAGDYPDPAQKTYQLLFNKDGKTLAIGIGLLNNGDSITRISSSVTTQKILRIHMNVRL